MLNPGLFNLKSSLLTGYGPSSDVCLSVTDSNVPVISKTFRDLKSFVHAIRILSLTKDCPSIIKSLVIDVQKRTIVFPKYVPLNRYLLDPSGIFNESPEKIVTFILKIYEGFLSLHQKNLIHGDISIKSIFIDLNDPQNPNPVISDLGFCHQVGDKRCSGTFQYMTPENQKSLTYCHTGRINSFETDSYAIGILTSFLFINFPEYYFSYIKPIVDRLSNYDPSSRISLAEAYSLLRSGKPLNSLEKINDPFQVSIYGENSLSHYIDKLLKEVFINVYNPALGKYYGFCIFQENNHYYVAINNKLIIKKIMESDPKLPSNVKDMCPRIIQEELLKHRFVQINSNLLYYTLIYDHLIPTSEIADYIIYMKC